MKVFVWHFAVQSHWGPQGMCWAETEHSSTHLHTHLHTHALSPTQAYSPKLWPGLMAHGTSSTKFCRCASKAQNNKPLPCGNTCGGRLHLNNEAWNSNFCQIGQLHLSEGDVKPVLMYFCTFMACCTRYGSAENPAQGKVHGEQLWLLLTICKMGRRETWSWSNKAKKIHRTF